ncbi:7-carboxy-7-deazaguanine synthase [Novispirillum itersonii]|uniref:7-carboxy-7-deazaguanine synthase n=1 Tax=Novispirillum itersonii TaxID=189 RepID=UPI00035CD58C|nr:7-carboxy-7-deazaguanine synthase [Novispirillum itersonii]
MTYSVKELFYTLQGEGAHSGRAAVFCRFTGCNLWSGREEDRATAQCQFCDTDFVGTDGEGGGKFATADALAAAVAACWSANAAHGSGIPYVICTGGEPLLQVDTALIEALHHRGFEIGVETNGTQPAPPGLDWVCVSPKAGTDLVLTHGDELKVVWPQAGHDLDTLGHLDFKHFFLQPMDGPDRDSALATCIATCHRTPRWRLSLQTHKMIGIP